MKTAACCRIVSLYCVNLKCKDDAQLLLNELVLFHEFSLTIKAQRWSQHSFTIDRISIHAMGHLHWL